MSEKSKLVTFLNYTKIFVKVNENFFFKLILTNKL